jgi:hypothetical protein
MAIGIQATEAAPQAEPTDRSVMETPSAAVTSEASHDLTLSTENLTAIAATNTTIDGAPGYPARPVVGGEYPPIAVIREW